MGIGGAIPQERCCTALGVIDRLAVAGAVVRLWIIKSALCAADFGKGWSIAEADHVQFLMALCTAKCGSVTEMPATFISLAEPQVVGV